LDQTFVIQDSYYGPDQLIKYEELNRYWRAFNFAYLVIYPDWYKIEVMNLIEPRSDNNDRYLYAAEKASEEINKLSGRDQFFAWFNRGSSLVALEDYYEAAVAYDQAFKLYPTIPEKERPWRMLWYQTGPYQAYYYTGRYQDVINLASTTLNAMSEPVLEESYYWRARALLALGGRDDAIKDLLTSLKYHPGFSPSLSLLQELDVDQ
jgi:tetratricopeptide (TPR) repeat protein